MKNHNLVIPYAGRSRIWTLMGAAAFSTILAPVAPGADAPAPNGLLGEEALRAQGTKNPPARWAVRLEPVPLAGILGRPSRFVVDDQHVTAPFFENAVVQRSTADGLALPFNSIHRFGSPVEQVTPMSICTVAASAGGGSPLMYKLDWIISGDAKAMVDHNETPWRVVPGLRHYACTCSDDGRIILWDVGGFGPTKMATIQGYARSADGSVTRGEFAAFSPFGRWLATVYDDSITFRLAHTGRVTSAWQPKMEDSQHVMAIRFDTNGNNLLGFVQDSKDDGGKRIRLLRFNIDTQKEDRIEGTRAATWGFALPDDETVVTFNGSPALSVWNLTKCEEATVVNAAPEHIYDLQLAPSGDTVATIGDDNVVKYWNTADWTQRETQIDYKHEGAKVFQFSPSGRYLVTLSDDGWLKVWDAPRFCRDRSPGLADTGQVQFGHEEYDNGMIRDTKPDGTVTETRPDGTVKVYKRQ
jgi:hypothetical protein